MYNIKSKNKNRTHFFSMRVISSEIIILVLCSRKDAFLRRKAISSSWLGAEQSSWYGTEGRRLKKRCLWLVGDGATTSLQSAYERTPWS